MPLNLNTSGGNLSLLDRPQRDPLDLTPERNPMDLNQLQVLLSQASQATGQQPGLQDQLARANVLRDTPTPTPVQGYTHPLEHIARGLKMARGDREATAATEGLAKARQQLAESQAGQTMYKLGTAEKYRGEDVEFKNKQADAVLAKADLAHQQSLDKEQRKRDWEGGKRTQAYLINPITQKVEGVDIGRDGKLYQNGELVANQHLWVTPSSQKAVKDVGSYKEAENKNYGYATRVYKGIEILDALDKSGYDPTTIKEQVLGSTDLTATARYQQYNQAQQDIIAAILRRESGAVISAEEMDRYGKIYFPLFTDSAQVKAQKRGALRRQLEALQASAGSGRIYGSPPTSSNGGPTGRSGSNSTDNLNMVFRGTGPGRQAMQLPPGMTSTEYNNLSPEDQEYVWMHGGEL